MTYQQTLDFMFAQLPMYQRQGKSAFKKDLTNIIKLCDYLGNPQNHFKTVHVAGTNGKGTVSHLLTFGLQVSGYKVGLYTSPHYKDFRERIKIGGALMEKDFVVNFIQKHMDFILEVQPSFFEITVAMAFQYFRESKVDYAVIEVGLGGRLDSTNIIVPELSVITNISYDHMDMLGDTLPLIAGEKAGIIKKGRPVVIGEYQEEIAHVFTKKAEVMQSQIQWAEEITSLKEDDGKYEVFIANQQVLSLDRQVLFGPFQQKNIITAIASLQLLIDNFNWKAFSENWLKFREEVYYLGRWQFLSYHPDVLIDSAHNEAGIGYLSKFLKECKSYSKIHIVCGFAADKDLDKILPLFPGDARYYFAKANVPRGMNAKQLQEKASRYGLIGKSYMSVRRALSAAKRSANADDLIFVGGSIFVVAEVV